ncbi:GNAT family N-acetyltransferase [Pleomorphomonas koreensis]|uniref:GNAT family N-acetyltransferase n=1 Tax=Pleomorphomonas koreensis TaxID=257440 RepID=UPI00041DD2C6|nr:GNAT family N-acetyltransferase [Pleomorphomonas koreensis]
MSGDATGLCIRDLLGMAEFHAAEELQRDVWGPDDKIDPGDLMMVIQAEGGLAAGAFLDGRLVGYVFAFPTATPGVQHSHRLAVRAEARGLGLGLKLKLYQASWCLERGIAHVRWTYDPLRLPNAALNIGRLGATAGTYHRDYYGAMGGINAGTASDRLLADWRLDGDRFARCRAGRAMLGDDEAAAARRIALPADFAGLLAADPAAAAAERLRLRGEIEAAFAAGLVIAGVDVRAPAYLLMPRAAC